MNENRAYTEGQTCQRNAQMAKNKAKEQGWDGARLAQLRKAAGYTQAELAEAMGGVTRRMIAYYETEADHPPAAMLAALVRALRVSVDELLGIEEIKVPAHAPSRRVIRRLQKIEQLPKRDQEALLRTIDAFLAKSA
jgi:transcriptional regulator with XRE-family HTH domain